jgi:peptide/nickel transport system substrate-binding protein
MNELVVEHKVVIPLVNRPNTNAQSSRLRAPMSGWDSDVWMLKDWYREA